MPLLVIGFILSLGIGLAIGFWDQLRSLAGGFGGGNADGPTYESELLAYRFVYPPSPWQIDMKNKFGLKCGVAMERTEPNCWLAILTQDYKNRTPSEADLVEEGVRRLREFFVKDETQDFFEYQVENGREYKLADQPASRMKFRAEVNNVVVVGEAYMMAHNGVGYWFVTWAPKTYEEIAREDWARARQNFALTRHRDGWTGEQAIKLATADGNKADYRLVYNRVVWSPGEPANYDPNADLFLLGRDVNEQEKQRDRLASEGRRVAYAAVLLLPKADDLPAAIEAARDYVLNQQKRDYPGTTIEDSEDTHGVSGRTEIGSEPGHLLRLRVRNTPQRERLVYLAVVRQPEQTVVIEQECAWEFRTFWEVNFQQLLRKFQGKKGK